MEERLENSFSILLLQCAFMLTYLLANIVPIFSLTLLLIRPKEIFDQPNSQYIR